MHLGLSADELLTTTRAVRKRLDLDRPVEREVIEECLRIAIQAPTGSNSQNWHWVMVTDPEKKRVLAEIYAGNFAEYAKFAQSNTYEEGDLRHAQRDRVTASAMYLVENFHRVPVIMVPCIFGKLDKLPTFAAASTWGSLLPAVWSFMLAARERGLGTAWTTIHLMSDGEQRAADILGIPFGEVTQAGLFPVAYTIGTDFRPAQRLPLAPILHWNQW